LEERSQTSWNKGAKQVGTKRKLIPSVGPVQKYWYLRLGVASEAASTRLLLDPSHRAVVGLLSFLTAVTLYSSVIPISLYVSIELIKYFQVTPPPLAKENIFPRGTPAPPFSAPPIFVGLTHTCATLPRKSNS